MYTSILLVALTGIAPSADEGKVPTWSQDYAAARKQSAQEKKPLAVFLAPGKGAYEKIGRDGGLGGEAQGLLTDKYVCVHIDTTTGKGREWAEAFEMPQGLGIVISDRTGDKQAFRHEGDLANADLVRYLQNYSDPNRVVEFTESNPGHRHAAPAAYGCSSGSCASGYCATCGGCSGGCSGGRHGHLGRRHGCSGGRHGCSSGRCGR
jgi:hypothetical protein